MSYQQSGSLLKVLYVFGGERAQGAEIVIERLISLNSANIETHLILSPGNFAELLMIRSPKYKITTFNNLKKLNRSSTSKATFLMKAIRNYFSISFFVYQYAKRHQIDIVHANTLVPSSYLFPFIIYCRVVSSKIKFLWSDHDLNYFSGLDRAQSKIAQKLYDYTLVVSEAVKKKYKSDRKILVLYNGLDLAFFKSDESKRASFRLAMSFANSELIIGMAASITPDKGQLTLIAAFNKINETFNNIKLLLTGNFAADTPEYNKSLLLAIEHNDNIAYLGHIEEMVDFYNGCDIIINNSNNFRSESLGTTIYEAMSCEKIVVAANTGGTPEIISDSINGFLFEPENIEDLQEKLTMVILNIDSLNEIRYAARKQVEQKFNITYMMNNYNEILRRIKSNYR